MRIKLPIYLFFDLLVKQFIYCSIHSLNLIQYQSIRTIRAFDV